MRRVRRWRRAGLAAATGWLVIAVMASAAGATTYDWPRIGHDPATTGLSPDPGISAANAARLGVRWMAGTGAPVVSSPVGAFNATLGESLVYLANEAGDLTAFNEANGATVWSSDLGGQILSTPLVEGDSVWATRDYSPALVKLDAATGATECSVPLVSTAEGSPTIGTPAGGRPTVYMAVNDLGEESGPVYAIDEATCSVDWTFDDFPTAAGSWDPLSFATDAHGRALVLFGSADPDNAVYALDARTGDEVWRVATAPLAGNSDTDIGAGVTVSAPGVDGFADGVAYVPAEDGLLYAIDLTTGTVMSTYDFSAGLSPIHMARSTAALVNGLLVFGENGGVTCVDARTMTLKWRFAGADTVSAVAAFGPPGKLAVAVSNVNGDFDVLSAGTGALLYQFPTGRYSTSSLADLNGHLLAASTDGFLYDLAPGGGNGTAPTTAVTSPAGGAVVANPAGSLTVTGTATASGPAKIGAVDVAVQAGGSSGPWWDGQTGTWTAGFSDNLATLARPGSAHTTWTYPFPVPPAGGSYRVLASAAQTNGLADVSDLDADPGPTNVTFTVRPAPGTPTVKAAGSGWVAPGSPVTVSGTGFAASERVDLALDGAVLARAVTSPTGALRATAVPIPGTATFGPAAIEATGTSSGRTASAPVVIGNAWASAGYDSTHTSFEPNDPLLLQSPTTGPPEYLSQAWVFVAGGALQGSVVVAQDVAYVADQSGQVSALDVHTSQPRWTEQEGSPIDATPAVAGTEVFVGTTAGAVVALDQATGATRWSTPAPAAVESSPAVAGNEVFVGTDDGTVEALSQAGGTVVWQASVPGSVTSSPSVDPAAGLVVVTDASGHITALSMATGRQLWQVATGGPITASATLWNHRVYVGSGDGTVEALAEQTGALQWSMDIGSPVTATGAIYATQQVGVDYAVGAQDGTVGLLDLATGTLDVLDTLSQPVVGLAASQGWIAVTGAGGGLWGLKRLGEALYDTTLPTGFASAPTVLDGVVYTAGLDHTVRAFTIPGRPIP